MQKKVARFIRVYPWYFGLTADLLFYVAINTLFFTVVKDFSAAQIVSLTSVSAIASIVLQFPLLWVIKKIGNTASIRMGALLMLVSAVCITFGPNYYIVALGRIFHDMSVIFRASSLVALENNLELTGQDGEFVKVRASGNTTYAFITMGVSFVASLMFNWNPYLPMYCCVGACAVGFGLTFLLKDHSSYNKLSRKKKTAGGKMHYSKVILLAVVVYGLFYALVAQEQSEGKLFIQQHLMQDYSVDTTSLVIGGILIASRVIRVLSNLVFVRIYRKLHFKAGNLFTALLCSSAALMLFGSFIPLTVVKILVMAVGYVIILFLRDPFNLYMQDVVFAYTERQHHQTVLTTMNFATKVGMAIMSLGFTFVLLKWPLVVEMAILLILAAVEVALGLWLYKNIRPAKTAAQS